MSTTSFMDEVEMAQDEMFAGPMGESVPTSIVCAQNTLKSQKSHGCC